MTKLRNNCNLVFYRCSVCGNLIIKLEDSGISPQCCGRDMNILFTEHAEDIGDTHIPVWRMAGCRLMVQVGSELHPMSPGHYITWIIVKTNYGLMLRRFEDTDIPEANFKLHKDETVEEIYSLCNIHGLWVAQEEESI